MDKIEALDEGVVAHFGHQAKQIPEIVPYMEPAYYISTYVGIGILLMLILFVLLVRGRWLAAVVAIVSFALAIALVEAVRFFVPRTRPQDAVRWLGDDASSGSYPAAGVFLFILGMILLGNALWVESRPWRNWAFVCVAALLTVWVCLSQFFLSLHFLTDVIGGMAGAALVGWLACTVLRAERKSPVPMP